MKVKVFYICQECGANFPKWSGQCTDCGAWNTLSLEEKIASPVKFQRYQGVTDNGQPVVTSLADIELQAKQRISSGQQELDRVLGGGIVEGSLILLGGNPGIGKSTLLLQCLHHLSSSIDVLYVSGEESPQQISLTAHRLNLTENKVNLLTCTNVEQIIAVAEENRPRAIVIDSIQTVYTNNVSSAPGTVSQVRESAALLASFAKSTDTTIFLVGHVTKEGTLAGPRVLEHMVDTVLYFEGERDGRYRMIRAVKNRFGAINELGVFAMTDRGLKEVSNPSAIFLSRYDQTIPGNSIMVTLEGSRPMLVEVQALVNESHLANPRRVAVGTDHNRLAILLAVLARHGHVQTYDQDVFVNIVGGVRITETAVDLALVVAIISSLRNKPLPEHLVIFGEVGLSGEIRPVQGGQERLKEAAKHGFKTAIIPKANMPRKNAKLKINAIPVQSITDVFNHIN